MRKVAREAVARGTERRRSALRLIRDEALGDEAEKVVPTRRRRASGQPRELTANAPQASGPRPARLAESLQKASRSIDRGYEQEALRILRPLKDRHPADPDVRELLGVAQYRLGRWAAARKELDAYVEMTGSAIHHPVLMDSARALGRHSVVDRLWEELRAASPVPEVMTEGRIVAAGSLADRGRLPEAIALLERGPISPKRIAEHHLRLWYALADLHERAGDIPGARHLFRRVSARNPAFVDVAERLAALS
ncbi:MAG: tetratricopeptide repeat protein [Acidimicrobiia bacterium]